MSCAIPENFVTIVPIEKERYYEDPQNIIGSEANTLREYDFTATDLNAKHVDGINGVDNPANGTRATPLKTLNYAIQEAISNGFDKIQIIEDGIYEMEWWLIGGNFLEIQSDKDKNVRIINTVNSISRVSLTPSANPYLNYMRMRYFNGQWGTQDLYLVDENQYLVTATAGGTTTNRFDFSTLHASFKATNVWSGIIRWKQRNGGSVSDPTEINSVWAFANRDYAMAYYREDDDGTRTAFNTPNNSFAAGSPQSGAMANDGTVPKGIIKAIPGSFVEDVGLSQYFYNVFFINETPDGNGGVDNELWIQIVKQGVPFNSATSYQLMDADDKPKDITQFRNRLYIAYNRGVRSINLECDVDQQNIQLKTFHEEPIDYDENFTCLSVYYENDGLPISDNDRLYASTNTGRILEFNPLTQTWKQIYEIEGYNFTYMERAKIPYCYDILYCRTDQGELIRIDLLNNTYCIFNDYTLDNFTFHNSDDYDNLIGLFISQGNDMMQFYEDIYLSKNFGFNGLKFEPLKNRKHSGFRFYGSSMATTDISYINYCDLLFETNKGLFINDSSPNELTFHFYNNIIKSSYYGLIFKDIDIDPIEQGSIGFDVHFKDNLIYHINQIGIMGHIKYKIAFNVFFDMYQGIFINIDDTDEIKAYNNVFLSLSSYCIKNISSDTYDAITSFNVVYDCNNNNTVITYDDIFYNCIENDNEDKQTIYNNPLFKSIIQDNEDFTYIIEKLCSVITSPCVVTPDENGDYDVVLCNYSGTGDYTSTQISSTIPIKYADYYLYVQNNCNLTLTIEGSDDLTTWYSLDEYLYNVTAAPETLQGILYPYNKYQYIRVDLDFDIGGVDFDMIVNLYYQDIGAWDVQLIKYAGYSQTPEVVLEYIPRSVSSEYSQSNEELINNFMGNAKLLSRKRQLVRTDFQFANNTSQGIEDPFKIALLHGLKGQLLKAYFDGLVDYYGLTATIRSEKPVNGYSTADIIVRSYYEQQGIDITQNYVMIDIGSDLLKFNEFKGWWIAYSDAHEANENFTADGYLKIVFHDNRYIWTETLASDLSISYPSNGSFRIEYFRCILPTTVATLPKDRYLRNQTIEGEQKIMGVNISLIEA